MPKDGLTEEVEKEVGQAEGKMFTHRSAFSRASVIQAFLGSAPQLTLQLYITVLQQSFTTGRCMYAWFLKPFLLTFEVQAEKQNSLYSGEVHLYVHSFWIYVLFDNLKSVS